MTNIYSTMNLTYMVKYSFIGDHFKKWQCLSILYPHHSKFLGNLLHILSERSVLFQKLANTIRERERERGMNCNFLLENPNEVQTFPIQFKKIAKMSELEIIA